MVVIPTFLFCMILDIGMVGWLSVERLRNGGILSFIYRLSFNHSFHGAYVRLAKCNYVQRNEHQYKEYRLFRFCEISQSRCFQYLQFYRYLYIDNFVFIGYNKVNTKPKTMEGTLLLRSRFLPRKPMTGKASVRSGRNIPSWNWNTGRRSSPPRPPLMSSILRPSAPLSAPMWESRCWRFWRSGA